MTKHGTGTNIWWLVTGQWQNTEWTQNIWVTEQWQNTELTQKQCDVDLLDNDETVNWHKKTHMKYWTVFQNTELTQKKTCELMNSDKTLNWHKHVSHQTMTKHWCWVTEHWTDTKNLRVTGLWQNTELTQIKM